MYYEEEEYTNADILNLHTYILENILNQCCRLLKERIPIYLKLPRENLRGLKVFGLWKEICTQTIDRT